MSNLSGAGANVWTTRDGRKMKWSQMAVPHIRNCAAMLERKVAADCAMTVTMSGEKGDHEFSGDGDMERLIDVAERMRAYASWRELTAKEPATCSP